MMTPLLPSNQLGRKGQLKGVLFSGHHVYIIIPIRKYHNVNEIIFSFSKTCWQQNGKIAQKQEAL